jgi:hypothetical protein
MKAQAARKLRRIVGVPLALAPLTFACAGTPSTPPPSGVGLTSAVDGTAGLVEHHRYHHHGGIILLIAMSLETLSISEAQEPAIDRVRTSLRTAMAAARVSDDSLLKALADGVDAGHVDGAALDVALATVGEQSAAVYAASVDALNELQRSLAPSQRAALFDKVAWHWTVWQSANGGSSQNNDWVVTIMDNLQLTARQAEDVHTALATRRRGAPAFDPKEVTASLRSLADAFQKTDFDARTITAASLADRHMATWGAGRLAYQVEAAVPVLDADQRALLGSTLRERVSHGAGAGRAR